MKADYLSQVPGLGSEALELFDNQEAGEYLEELKEANLLRDAILLVTATMPLRDAIWWGCLCCEEGFAGKLSGEKWKALQLTGHWVIDPNCCTANDLEAAADDADVGTATGAIARAAALATMVDANDTESIERQMAIRLVAAAVLSASSACGEGNSALHQFLAIGVEVSQGKLGWM